MVTVYEIEKLLELREREVREHVQIAERVRALAKKWVAEGTYARNAEQSMSREAGGRC